MSIRPGSSQDRYTYLTTTPVNRLIITLAIPTMISMLVTGIYNTADTYFVGRISTQATAAVGLSFTVMSIIQAFGFFCGQGSGNYISRMLGAGKRKEANEAAATGFALALLIGLTIAIAGIFFVRKLALLIGATPTTLDDAAMYMRIILCGAPFMMCQFVINNQLRFQGAAFYAMIGLLCGAILNLFLDPLFIFVFHMGVAGAATATVISQFVSFVVLLIGSSKGENIRLSVRNVRFNRHYLFEIVNGGSPSLARQGMAAISAILLNTSAGTIGGDAAIAGMSVATRVFMLVNSLLIGFGQGYQPVCSFNYGANLKKRVYDGFMFCIRCGMIFFTAAGTLCFIFAPHIIAWFRPDPEVVAVGKAALRYQAVVMPFLPVVFIANMLLQSIGKGFKASVTSSARSGIFFIPLILILPRVLSLTGVEITQACADVCAIAISIPLVWSELKTMRPSAE